ncbi:hypothetical protein Stsp02_19980 [Streptomyces sp. NBRC 14336]|uniref:hypothetical protein n=1 Tax=Streptomyces sp. NBRC 14336 TaxID=3030992 RepID=UPI0024A06F79|nr:hypothetical protein [Streptomyces sp. NBRC 14336]WBO81748.1 hypothetical protein SBE_005625 [Streptomyces sp. SBE_14.2]GLW46336.1 hypothetical protein Stsp02_19980 [Streptomyces sp. NBRC 14336]
MLRRLTEANVLEVWEGGLGSTPVARALLIASTAMPSGGEQDVADLPLSAVNKLLLDLRCGAFGDALPCTTDCPACGESLDVTVSAEELRPASASGRTGDTVAGPATATLMTGGLTITYRALTGRDVQAVDTSAPGARRALVRRSVLSVSPHVDDLPDAALDALAPRLAELDPGADTVLTLDCPQCEHRWEAALDIAEHVWTDVSGYAHRVLHDVHALAQAYGWSEAEVLSVSPARRQFYLEVSSQ